MRLWTVHAIDQLENILAYLRKGLSRNIEKAIDTNLLRSVTVGLRGGT